MLLLYTAILGAIAGFIWGIKDKGANIIAATILLAFGGLTLGVITLLLLSNVGNSQSVITQETVLTGYDNEIRDGKLTLFTKNEDRQEASISFTVRKNTLVKQTDDNSRLEKHEEIYTNKVVDHLVKPVRERRYELHLNEKDVRE